MGARGLNTGVDEERLGPPAPAVALVDVPEDVDARLEAVREEPQQVPAARLDLPGILVPDPVWRHVGDQDVDITGDLLPLLPQLTSPYLERFPRLTMSGCPRRPVHFYSELWTDVYEVLLVLQVYDRLVPLHVVLHLLQPEHLGWFMLTNRDCHVSAGVW